MSFVETRMKDMRCPEWLNAERGPVWLNVDMITSVCLFEEVDHGKRRFGVRVFMGENNIDLAARYDDEGDASKAVRSLLGIKNVPDEDVPKRALFTDERDGNIYMTVKIGNQIWFADNFRFHYKNSRELNGNSTFGAIHVHGRLYTREMVELVKPEGWRLPSKEEWAFLSSEDFGMLNLDKKGGFIDEKGGSDSLGKKGLWWLGNDEASLNSDRGDTAGTDGQSIVYMPNNYFLRVRFVKDV